MTVCQAKNGKILEFIFMWFNTRKSNFAYKNILKYSHFLPDKLSCPTLKTCFCSTLLSGGNYRHKVTHVYISVQCHYSIHFLYNFPTFIKSTSATAQCLCLTYALENL